MTIPRVVLIYGLAGLIPFLGLPLLGWNRPDLAADCVRWQALYGALILSFLGGARWGQAVQAARPSPLVVSISMLPSIAGWFLLLSEYDLGRAAVLKGLAGALIAHWLWDLNSAGLPAWYPRLRAILTVGAVAGLLASTLLIG
jgi:Protein of unknown function (DUF3429)